MNPIVDEHWIELAAFAWSEYETHGRGAVLLNLSQIDDADEAITTRGLAYLCPEDDRVKEVGTAWENGSAEFLRDVIMAYEPAVSIVLVCVTTDVHIDVSVQRHPFISPPEAAAIS